MTAIKSLDVNIVNKTTIAGDYQLYTKELQEKEILFYPLKK